jgi:hypothetical protein
MGAAMFAGLAEGECPSSTAQGNSHRGAERRIDYNYNQGVDLAFYRLVQGEATCNLQDCEFSAPARTETKDKAYETAFQRIDQMGRTYGLARPYYFEGFHRLLNKEDKSVLAQDVVFLKALEIYDYQHCEYKYTVELGVLKVPRLMLPLEADFKNFLEKIRPRENNGVVIFDLAAILSQLRADPQFLARLRGYKGDPAFESSLHFKDDDTQRFLRASQGFQVKIGGYNRGQYNANSLVGSIIQGAVTPTILKYLGQYRSVDVLCEGAADALQITKALDYQGEGRAGAVGEHLPLNSSAGRFLHGGIRNNTDLSFARAYEGIRALEQLLGPAFQSGRVHLSYTGIGVAASQSGDQPESRRIIFKIQLGPKLN